MKDRRTIYISAGYPPDAVLSLPEKPGEERNEIEITRLAKLYASRGYLQAAQYLVSLANTYTPLQELAEIEKKLEEIIWRINTEITKEILQEQHRKSIGERQQHQTA